MGGEMEVYKCYDTPSKIIPFVLNPPSISLRLKLLLTSPPLLLVFACTFPPFKSIYFLTSQQLVLTRRIMSSKDGAILGYELGEIKAEAGFTSEFRLGMNVPLQDLVNLQESERWIMDDRPGMYLKYLPCRYDPITGQIHVGGGYLFDTMENAAGYDHWTTNEFEVGPQKEKFWSRTIFKDVKRRSWKVIGAVNFTLPDQHAVSRFQRWKYTGDDDDTHAALKALYPAIKTSSKKDGLNAVWVLHQPAEKLIGIVTLAGNKSKTETHEDDPLAAAQSSLTQLQRLDTLGNLLSAKLAVQSVFDRTSLILSLWLPKSRRAGGAPQSTPNFPVFPAVTIASEQS
jgi:hypothetical protein